VIAEEVAEHYEGERQWRARRQATAAEPPAGSA
jgi:hypothetical protein